MEPSFFNSLFFCCTLKLLSIRLSTDSISDSEGLVCEHFTLKKFNNQGNFLFYFSLSILVVDGLD